MLRAAYWRTGDNYDMADQPPRRQRARYQLNAPGDFYVEDQECIACGAPEAAAPTLMNSLNDPGPTHCYFRRQPGTETELKQAIEAVCVSCCGAVRYGGADQRVIAEIRRGGSAYACDQLEPERDADLQPQREEHERAGQPLDGSRVARWLRMIVRRLSG